MEPPPPPGKALEEVELGGVEVYIIWRHNEVTQFVGVCLIMEICIRV